MRTPHRLLFLFCGALVTLTGCQKVPEIESYEVTYPDREPLRVLGAIVPHDDKLWFFFLSGPAAAVEPQRQAFDGFLDSVKFDDAKDPPFTATAPAGWTQEPASGMRLATFRIDSKPRKLELTVTAFPKGRNNTVLANVNRWRKQIALPALEEAELDQNVSRRTVGGEGAWVVDAVGLGTYKEAKPATPKDPHAGLGFNPPAARERPKLPFSYELPKGWEKTPQNKPLSAETLVVEDGGKPAFITMTPLGGGGGDLVPNVNRWRKQVGLSELPEAEVLAGVKELKVDGQPAKYVDLNNEKSTDAVGRILVAIVPIGQQTWFFKMTGPTDVVGRQKAEFETFIGSLKLSAR